MSAPSLPLVSVLIPAYNHAAYVEECLNSVLNEGYPNLEIIIINDGSKDNTEQKIETWIEANQKALPITFKSRPNKGITKSLNEMLALAKGDYLVIIASDDYLLPGGIHARLTALQNNPDKLAVIGDCHIIDTVGNITHQSAFKDRSKANIANYLNPKTFQREIIENFCVPGPVLMYKKEIFNTIRPYNEAMNGEDLDFYYQAAYNNLLLYIDTSVSAYRIHGNNATHRPFFVTLLEEELQLQLEYIRTFKGYQRVFLKKIVQTSFYISYLKLKYFLKNRPNLGSFYELLMKLVQLKKRLST
jgi:glycosyltransferase involved in cell wall biosynthesis